MPWIRVRIRSPSGSEVETSAVANSGFMWRVRQPGGDEVSLPVINIPAPLARRLGIAPVRYDSSSDVAGHLRVPTADLGRVEVRLVVPGRETPWIRAWAICIQGESRVLLSEGLMEHLRVLPFGRKWLIFGEAELREEAEPQFWTEK